MESGIYAIRNTVNGKVYVGSAVNILVRFQAHLRGLRGGKHHSEKLQRAWDKYGDTAFRLVVLERVADRAALLSREQWHMDAMAAYSEGYNSCPVAGSKLGTKLRPESKARISAANMGRRHTAEARAKMSASCMGRSLSVGAVEKLRLAREGQRHTQESIARMRLVQSGKTISEAQRAKISAALSGRTESDETRARKSAAQMNRKHSPETREKLRQIVSAYWAAKRAQ
jgi:group I intron endonuclease